MTTRITVDVANIGAAVALMTHLQVFDPSTGARVLPAFHSDNYLNLLPGGKRQITIDLPHARGAPVSRVALRVDGWRLDRPNCGWGSAACRSCSTSARWRSRRPCRRSRPADGGVCCVRARQAGASR
uniref:hypothetical protein n=1 Tax=Burkholderia sp. AU33423 TaxID=2015355 RepID=UPI00211B089D|nr:hypothetical protein [Burkholderia sp. AU33423]